MLCATILRDPIFAIQAANQKADKIELHLDYLKTYNIKDLRNLCRKPVIFKQQCVDFSLLRLSPDYIDLPHHTHPKIFEEIGKQFPKIKRICSRHDFEKTGDLDCLFAQIKSVEAEYYKIATHAHTTLDALRMLKFIQKTRCIGICMGENGIVTRILAQVMGAPWTYAPISEEQRTAPGQLLLDELVQIYNIRSHRPHTALYGLIGDPVSHSQSHQVHNFAFKRLGVDAVYVKMQVQQEGLEETIKLCKDIGFKGLSVTMPHKEVITSYLDDYENDAINTVGFFPDKICGWNTDGYGALEALENKISVRGKKIVVLGAGGAAKAIVLEAKKRGASIVVLNRTLFRAKQLAEVVDGTAFHLSSFAQAAKAGYDILINCTSVGMEGDQSLPIEEKDLLEKRVVMDIITKPAMTPLLEAAKKKKCMIIKGMEMWVKQAVGQYNHWFLHGQ